MSPYGAVTEAFQTVPANLTMKQWQALGDIFNIQLGEIAAAYRRGGRQMVEQLRLDQLTLPNILRVFTKVQEAQSESKVLTKIQNLVDEAINAYNQQLGKDYNAYFQSRYPNVNATAIGNTIFTKIGTANATNATTSSNSTNATNATLATVNATNATSTAVNATNTTLPIINATNATNATQDSDLWEDIT